MAVVKKYKAVIVSFSNPFDNIFTLELKPQNGAFKFLPGQFLHLALDDYDPSTNWPESRCFSIQSASIEPTLKITFAANGKFTKRMSNELKVERTLDIKMPYGELFQQEHSKEDLVFIAGGTGITPFLSLFNDPIFANYKNPKAWFGLKSESYNIYKDQILKANQINRTLEVRTIYQDIEGILNIEEILKSNGIEKTYFISGPQAMIKSFRSFLFENSVSQDNIKTDDWE